MCCKTTSAGKLGEGGPSRAAGIGIGGTLSGRLEEGGLQYTRGARALSNKIPEFGTRAPSYQPYCILLQSAQRCGAQHSIEVPSHLSARPACADP